VSSKEQSLVNAQVKVNRAVWAMNSVMNKSAAATMDGLPPKQYIRKCIDKAIEDLQEAKKGYPLPEKKKK